MDTTPNSGDLLDVIATLTSRGESGRLQINVPGSVGAFFFKNGKLVDARMGPFSGFPAVNYAVSLGKATLKFDSSILPPAVTSTVIATNERMLLKERFGIEAIDVELLDVDQTTQIVSKLPISVITQALVAEAAPTLVAKAPRESTHRRSNQNDIHCSARARESRRRTARSRRAGRKKKEPGVANQLRNQATEPARKNNEQYIERESGIADQQTHGATSTPATPTQSCMIETREGAKPSEITDSASTLELTANQHPSNRKIIGIARDALFIAAAKSDAAARPLSWTLITIIFLVSVVLGYYVSSNFSRRQAAASTPIRAEVKPPPNADQDGPIIEGTLHGKEAVLEKPEYPPRARSEGVSGKVTVAILVDQQGRVVSARALNGPPLLKDAAVKAARRSKFSPDNAKRFHSGTITYNFKS